MVADLLALRRVPTRFFGVFMSVNPVFAALTGLVVLGQSLGVVDWVAIAAIVTANAVSVGAGSAGRGNGVGHDEVMTSSLDSNPENEYADDEYADYDAEDREQPSTPSEIPDDEPEDDVLEQRQEVPYGEDDQ